MKFLSLKRSRANSDSENHLNNENCYLLCVLEHQKFFFEIYFFSLFINKESFGRKVSKENSLSCLVPQQERFFPKKGNITFPTFL